MVLGKHPAAVDLESRVIVVTGGGSGIGSAIAEGLVRSGAHVSVWGRDGARLDAFADRMAATYGTAPLAIAANVVDEASVEAAFSRVVGEWGTVDGLVNNAGISKVGPSTEFELADFRRIIDVNVTGLFLCSQQAARIMREVRRGSILNIASISSFIGQPERAAYVASKSAVAGLTRSLAVEWGELGIRVNAIAPGYIETDLVADLVGRGVLSTDAIAARTPLRRMGQTGDLVGGALYLLSDMASFVTGQVLQIDGGWLANGYFK